MNFNHIPAGKNIPEDIYVIIEITANANPIKYEINKESSVLFVDRFIPTAMFYPCNYGYINCTMSLDGDPLDALVITQYPLYPKSVIRCRPIGILKMIDESGKDIKLLTVPHAKVSDYYNDIKDINDISQTLKNQIVHFFEHYKDLEYGKWTKISGWGNLEEANLEIITGYERAKK